MSQSQVVRTAWTARAKHAALAGSLEDTLPQDDGEALIASLPGYELERLDHWCRQQRDESETTGEMFYWSHRLATLEKPLLKHRRGVGIARETRERASRKRSPSNEKRGPKPTPQSAKVDLNTIRRRWRKEASFFPEGKSRSKLSDELCDLKRLSDVDLVVLREFCRKSRSRHSGDGTKQFWAAHIKLIQEIETQREKGYFLNEPRERKTGSKLDDRTLKVLSGLREAPPQSGNARFVQGGSPGSRRR